MKITRKELRRLIAEAFRYIVDDEGAAYPADDAFRSGASKDHQSLGIHPKLDNLMQSTNIANQRQGRELAVSMDYQPELTDAEATAVEMGYDKSTEPDLPTQYQHVPVLAFKLAKEIEKVCDQYYTECNISINSNKVNKHVESEFTDSRPVVVTIDFPPDDDHRSEGGKAEVYIYDKEVGVFMGSAPARNSVAIEIYGDYDRDMVDYDFQETKKFFEAGDLNPLAEAVFGSAMRLIYFGDEEGVELP